MKIDSVRIEVEIGGGVAGAIHSAAGRELFEECKKYAPIK